MRVIETPRLILRPFTDDDLDAVAELFGNAEVMRFSLYGTKSRDQCAEWLAGILAHYSTYGFGLWAAVWKEEQKVIGYCGLKTWDDIAGQEEVEIGYRLMPHTWGHGLATEAAIASRDFGFSVGLKRLISLIEPENVGSWRVAEKVGMTHERDLDIEGLTVRVYAIERQ